MKERITNNVKNRFLPITESVSKGLEPEPKISDFDFVKELGTGSFGRVYLVSHKKTKALFALKAIDKKNKANQEEKPYFRREIEIMYRIHHPNVVKLYGHFEDNNYCYFIMEYISKGNMYHLIPKDKKKRLTTQLVASLMKDVISAVYFLHNMRPPIVHRDIKPENVLLADGLKAKLTDFGWSNYLQGENKRNTVCGTPIYLAPEMINETGHDERVDIWCIGVLLFELITGSVPFMGNDIDTLKNNIKHMNIVWPRDINPDAEDLISRILKYNPKDRLTIEEIINHQFFTKFFPNASSCLIKPDNNNIPRYKTFIVSKDDPKTWDPIINNSDKERERDLFIKRANTANSNVKRNNNLISSQNTSSTNTNTSYEKDDGYSQERYNTLLKKYDSLKQDFYNLKSSSNNELDKFRRELKNVDEQINRIIEKNRINSNNKNSNILTELMILYEELKNENFELKDRIQQYDKCLKEQRAIIIDSNLNEIRDSVKGNNKANFTRAVDQLKTNLDEETKKHFDSIIKVKENQIIKLKEEEKIRREREVQKFAALINKYDRTLSWQEKKNEELKKKLQDLERKAQFL